MNKKVGLSIISIGTLLTVTGIVFSTSSGILVRSTTTDYTITLNESNKYAGSNKTITTDSGLWSINFNYSGCSTSTSGHAVLSADGYITNTDPIHYISEITATFVDDLYVQFSSDATSWGSEYALTSGTKLSVNGTNHYIKLYTDTGCALTSLTIKYACTAAPTPTYDVSSYYDGYYSSIVSWTNGEDLKQQLYDVMRSNYNPLSYNEPTNWETNKYADHVLDSTLKLDVLYSNEDVTASLTNTKWQREHAFCASLMTNSLTSAAVGFLGRATDFHNLIAGSSHGNTSRGNKNYGEADPSDANYTDETVNNGYDGFSYDRKNFEPGDKDKGRVARAIFYMATMHKEDEQDTVNGKLMKGLTVVENYVDYDSSNCQFAHGNLSTLLNWNNSFAPDRLEMQHNVSVQKHVYSVLNKAQGNRNPYVDYPGLVDYAFGSKVNEAGRLENIKPAAIDLDANSSEHRYYTLESAKDKYSVGTSFSHDDVVIIDVAKDFNETVYTGSWTSTLDNHTFAATDGDSLTNTITIGTQTLKYDVAIEGMTVCNFYHEMKWTGSAITNGLVKAPGTNNYTWEGKSFSATITSDGTKIGGSNKSTGGCIIGSGTSGSQLRSFTITSTNSYSINQFYVSLCPNNTNSTNIKLNLYVGDTKVYSFSCPYNSNKTPVIYGGDIDSSLNGTIKVEVTGQTSILFEAFAFNVVE